VISDIRLQHFRSYGDETFELDKGVNIVVGPNASGKTNLLEALLVGFLGGSYRVRDAELIKHGKPWSRLDMHTDEGVRTLKLERAPNERVQKNFVINKYVHRRLPQSKTLPVVLFEPNHLQLLHGPRELRREFMDNLLEQLVPGFGSTRRQYKRALAQRNALLKLQSPEAKPQLFTWNIRLSELGGQIADARQKLLSQINEMITELYQKLSHSDAKVELVYLTSCGGAQYGSRMLQKLDEHSELDLQRGFTAYGPHRDDIQILLNGHKAEETASRGEIRTLLLCLKIIETRLLEETRGKKPILLLDDVFSELDGARRRALTDFLSGYQVIITTTDADVVVQHFMDRCHIIPIQKS